MTLYRGESTIEKSIIWSIRECWWPLSNEICAGRVTDNPEIERAEVCTQCIYADASRICAEIDLVCPSPQQRMPLLWNYRSLAEFVSFFSSGCECACTSLKMLYYEPSLDALSLLSDDISSIQILSLQERVPLLLLPGLARLQGPSS